MTQSTENNRIQILLVEDDAVLAGEIMSFLEKWNYHVFLPRNFQAVAETCHARKPQLVLMDINLPAFDGFYWCQKIREFSQVPILYLSSRNDDKDQLQAYALGGDDYLEKPFSLDILRAKVDAVLKRTYRTCLPDKIYLTESVAYDMGNRELYVHDNPVELTPSEHRILGKLIECRGEVVTRESLMLTLWNTDEFISDNALTVLVNRLRSRLNEYCGDDFIKTKKGQGYYLL